MSIEYGDIMGHSKRKCISSSMFLLPKFWQNLQIRFSLLNIPHWRSIARLWLLHSSSGLCGVSSSGLCGASSSGLCGVSSSGLCGASSSGLCGVSSSGLCGERLVIELYLIPQANRIYWNSHFHVTGLPFRKLPQNDKGHYGPFG